MIFDDFFQFSEFVGILSKEQLRPLGIASDDLMGRFHVHRLAELNQFVAQNPGHHIVTETSDHDDFEYGGQTMDNEVRFVNRLSYFLANGSDAEAHLIEEDEPDEWSQDSEGEVDSEPDGPFVRPD